MGCELIFTGCTTYDQGNVSPVFCGGPSVRTGLPTCYNYIDNYGASFYSGSSSLSNVAIFPTREVLEGTNSFYSSVSYSAGCYPLKSDGTSGSTCCASGTTTDNLCEIAGILPYFYGSTGNTPTIGNALLASGCKCVAYSIYDVVVDNYCASSEYLWFAVPSNANAKTAWIGGNTCANYGSIPGDLFASGVTCTVDSPDGCWTGCSYNFYVSCYPTSVNYSMTFKNS